MRVVIYARYSSSMQREESIEAQVRACTEYIQKQKGWVLVGEYIDRAFSARSDQRPEFQRMIEDAKKHKFDAIVIHKLDRFSRDRYDHAFYKRELKHAGVTLYSVLENLDDSPESVILESVLEGFSEYYSKNLGREVMKGLYETARACKHTGGVPPLGYDVTHEGKYVINEAEAAAVRYIFEAYADGLGYTAIVDRLKAMGIRGKRGSIIAKNSLHDILCNEKYTGVYVYNRAVSKDAFGRRNGHANKPDEEIVKIPGGMPAIISADVWNRVRARMRVNKSGRHRAKEPYLLSGLIFCGKCGNLMTGNSRGVELKYYYECSGKKRLRECDAQGIERDQIENIVIEYLENLLSKETLDSVATWIAENARLYRKNAAAESKTIQRELVAVTKEAETLLDKIMSGLDSELARQRLADAEARKLHLEIKLSDIMAIAESAQRVTKTDVRLYLSQLKGIRQKERHEQAKIIRLFIARIEMHPADNNGERQLKITTKLDKLLDNKRTVKVELSLRHYYPHGTPYFIEQTVILGNKKEPAP
jgi:site-specific DNA recombinase